MNDLIEIKDLKSKVISYFTNNYKIIFIFLSAIIILFAIFQLYLFNKKNNILESSILYNDIQSIESDLDYQNKMDNLSNKKNFYGIFATLEKIKIKNKKNEINTAYEDYISLLNNKSFDVLYQSAIAIKASYELINTISYDQDNKTTKMKDIEDILLKINNLINFIDNSIVQYEGYKLELLYLISIIKNDINLNSDPQKTESIFNEIQNNDNISPSLKERINKINEFQKYN